MSSLLVLAIGWFVNVLLNDYTIYKTNQNVSAKVARKFSKLLLTVCNMLLIRNVFNI